MKTETLSGDEFNHAVELLARGEVVALPTETVYGLAGDATRADAVAKIFEAKDRPSFDPLIVHLPDLEWLPRVAKIDGNSLTKKLIEEFWPGPLSIVLPRTELIPSLVTAGADTVAVRMSAHPVFEKIIRIFGRPLAAPSANRFGRISPTTAGHVFSELGGRIPLIIDAGATNHGIESTIVSIDNSRVKILRPGPITREQLEAVGAVVGLDGDANPTVPGSMKSHYAPRTKLVIMDGGVRSAEWKHGRVGLLAWQHSRDDGSFKATRWLSARQDFREAAANLFTALRELDEANLDLIVAERVPEIGLGVAIMDRLKKASANG